MTAFINCTQFPTNVKTALLKVQDRREVRMVMGQAGYRLIDGRANAQGPGYYPAREGGGYATVAVPCGHCVTVEAGAPGYHATVAVKGLA